MNSIIKSVWRVFIVLRKPVEIYGQNSWRNKSDRHRTKQKTAQTDCLWTKPHSIHGKELNISYCVSDMPENRPCVPTIPIEEASDDDTRSLEANCENAKCCSCRVMYLLKNMRIGQVRRLFGIWLLILLNTPDINLFAENVRSIVTSNLIYNVEFEMTAASWQNVCFF